MFAKEVEDCIQAIGLETNKTSAYPYVATGTFVNPNLSFSAWGVGLHLTKLKAQHRNKCANKKKSKKVKVPTWSSLLKEKFGAIVEGDVSQWANRRMRVYATYGEEDMQLAHMDFTTAYSMITFPASERNKWLQISREKLVTHAMILEKGNVLQRTVQSQCVYARILAPSQCVYARILAPTNSHTSHNYHDLNINQHSIHKHQRFLKQKKRPSRNYQGNLIAGFKNWRFFLTFL